MRTIGKQGFHEQGIQGLAESDDGVSCIIRRAGELHLLPQRQRPFRPSVFHLGIPQRILDCGRSLPSLTSPKKTFHSGERFARETAP
jgi:hypothetical protein